MALDHAQAAKDLLEAVGGPSNIVSFAHCATRMRLVIADDSKVDKDKVENAAGAKGNFQASGQLQVIYGTGTVDKVYDEFVKQSGLSAGSKDDAKAAGANKGNPFQRAIKALGDCFVPIIPAIVSCGILMGLTEGLTAGKGLEGLANQPWYILIHTFSNAAFVFLQILIGFSAARVFGGNEFLGGVIGMVMDHTSLLNAWTIPTCTNAWGSSGAYHVIGSSESLTWLKGIGEQLTHNNNVIYALNGECFAEETSGATKIVADGLYLTSRDSASDVTQDLIQSVDGIAQVQLFGFYNVSLTGYQGHVIPVLIAVFVMCQLEKWLHAHVPDMIDLFVTPLCSVLVTGVLTMTVIGPFFSWVENGIMNAFTWLLSLPFGIGGALVGALYPITVVLGIHHMFNALEATMIATYDYDTFNPVISCCNVAQGTACLAVFIKTKNMKLKELALPSGLSGFLGITEPAVYGVNLPRMKPFVAALIGAAAGGAVSNMLGVVSIAYGTTGIFGFLITVPYTWQYAVSLAVTIVVTFLITSAVFKDDAPAATAAKVAAEAKATAAAAAAVAETAEAAAEAEEAAPAAVTAETIVAPMAGKAVALADVSDPVFASEAMGKGMAIDPTEGKVFSPVDGTITVLAETGHAVGLLSDDGAEILLHIGIDTVELKGGPFSPRVKMGQDVKKGDLLMEVDLKAVEKAGKSTTTMVIITNTDEYNSVDAVGIGTDVKPGDAVIEVK